MRSFDFIFFQTYVLSIFLWWWLVLEKLKYCLYYESRFIKFDIFTSSRWYLRLSHDLLVKAKRSLILEVNFCLSGFAVRAVQNDWRKERGGERVRKLWSLLIKHLVRQTTDCRCLHCPNGLESWIVKITN